MKIKNDVNLNLSDRQWIALVILRVIIGWHIVYEGWVKIADPEWSAAVFLNQSTWIFSGFFMAIAESEFWLTFIDVFNQWALCLIGAALIAGLFTRTAGIAGSILLLSYYLVNPPLFSQDLLLSGEGQVIIVNKLLIEAVTLFTISLFPTGRVIGLDYLIAKIKAKDAV